MKKTILVALGALLVFGAVSAILLRFMPEPIEDSDYLVAGSVGTLIALIVLFVGLVPRSGDIFFKKRRKAK